MNTCECCGTVSTLFRNEQSHPGPKVFMDGYDHIGRNYLMCCECYVKNDNEIYYDFSCRICRQMLNKKKKSLK